MKRFAMAALILVILSSASAARNITFGAKSGIFSANITTVPEGWHDTAFKNGFIGGVYGNYAFTKDVSVQLEVLYAEKGSEGSIVYPGFINYQFDSRFNYIDIPILGRYTMRADHSFKPYFLLGPSVGISIKAEMDVKGEELRWDPILQQVVMGPVNAIYDYSDVTTTTDLAIVFGFGFEYTMGFSRLSIDGRFNMGRTHFIQAGTVTGHGIAGTNLPPTIDYEDEQTKNIGFALMMGLSF
ncbi:MAG: PorT family protein [Candidatus Krumholzibacteriota bacterium]|nr:PorT family protein [Candidatus Krumholzibacteriota bacterium]